MRRAIRVREEGATAVLLSIILLMVVLPLAAAGLSAYLRTGTSDEMQRSADAGALAGARIIPLGDPEFLRSYLNAIASGTPDGVLPTFGGPDPLAEACARARTSLIEDSALGEDYADPTAASCAAEYMADLGLVGDVQSCLEDLAGSAPSIAAGNVSVNLPALLPPPLGGSTKQFAIQGQDVANLLFSQLGAVLPALLKPGIRVELERTFEGAPLEPIVTDPDINPANEAANNTETRIATARRRFKNVIVIPIVEAEYLVDTTSHSGVDLDGDGDLDVQIDSGTKVQVDASIDLTPALDSSWSDISSQVTEFSDSIDGLLTTLGSPVTVPGGVVTLDATAGGAGAIPGVVGGEITVTTNAATPPVIGFDCQLEIKRLLDDLDDIYSPTAGSTQEQIIEEAEQTGTLVYAFIVSEDPDNPTTELNMGNLAEPLGIPFFDFVPVCISGNVAVPTSQEIGCTANATGGFRASLVPNE